MGLGDYRNSPLEQLRTADVLRHMPPRGAVALDIGARDGHFSLLLAERFDRVIALDLVRPTINHPRVECVQCSAVSLPLADQSVDFVLCTEVLEHIAQPELARVCSELVRVCRGQMLIGVPYLQDIRVGRTTCSHCGGKNPPWGHVHCFDERSLLALFPTCELAGQTFVGRNTESTNALACWLMDRAGNPYGTYGQEEVCIHCGHSLAAPPGRTLAQKLLTRFALWARRATERFSAARAHWIHVLLTAKPAGPSQARGLARGQ